jgi:CDP-diglyceride synthetase
MVDHHTVAAISIAGSCLDVLGSLYLAYDLLGGKHGPLRLLTRAVTYSILFGLGYGLGLGLVFGVTCGIATGITVSIELNRAARGLRHYSLPWEAFFSAIRGIAFGAALYRILGFGFAAAFASLTTAGQVFGYYRGLRPGMDYDSESRRPRLTRRQFWGTVRRAIAHVAAALVCSAFIHHVDHAWLFAIRIGLVTGMVTGVGQMVNPYIEYYAENLPERWLGAFGIGLIFCGFALQSLQYWLALFDVHLA